MEEQNEQIGDAEDIFTEAQSYIECVRLAACQLETSEESEAIAAVAMAAYQKIGEGIALLDDCPEVRMINEAEAERLRYQFHKAANANPVPAAAAADGIPTNANEEARQMTTKPKTRKARWHVGQEIRSRNPILQHDVAMVRGENRRHNGRCECFLHRVSRRRALRTSYRRYPERRMTLLRLRYLTLKLRALCLVLRRLRAGRLSCPWLTPLGERHVPLGYMILANWFVSRGRFFTSRAPVPCKQHTQRIARASERQILRSPYRSRSVSVCADSHTKIYTRSPHARIDST